MGCGARVLQTEGVTAPAALGIPGSSVWPADHVRVDGIEDLGGTRPRSWDAILWETRS